MKDRFFDSLVLAFHATSRGFGYVLFESPLAPYDWGTHRMRGSDKNGRILRLIERLIDAQKPIALVLEDWRDESARRAPRIVALYRELIALAEAKAIRVFHYTREKIREVFGRYSASTRHEIAVEIGLRIPAFARTVPPVRELWMSEDPRQSLFDAAALGLTFYVVHVPSS